MRIRTIKPGFWHNEQLAKCSEFARLLALALLNLADDEGYFLAHPAIIRGQLFPYLDDSKKVEKALAELVQVEFVQVKTDKNGRNVGCVTKFRQHQIISRPTRSSLKDSFSLMEHSWSPHGVFMESSVREKEREEEKEQEREKEEEGGVGEVSSLRADVSAKPKRAKVEPDPRHRQTIELYTAAWNEQFGQPYTFAVSDAAKLKTFLQANKSEPAAIVETAKRAWSRHAKLGDRGAWVCGKAVTLAGLCNYFSEIVAQTRPADKSDVGHSFNVDIEDIQTR
jgi:hypothetical protein